MREFGTKIAKNGSNGSAGEAHHMKSAVMSGDGIGFQPLGGPVSVAWREGTLTRAYELQALCDWMTAKNSLDGDWVLVNAVKCHLAAARDAALAKKLDPHKRFRIFRDGPLIERARSNLDAAEAQLLNLAPPDYVLGQMPSLLRHVQRHLRPTDPGRQEFERIARSVGINDPDHPSRQNGREQEQGRSRRGDDQEGARQDRHNGPSGKLGGAPRECSGAQLP